MNDESSAILFFGKREKKFCVRACKSYQVNCFVKVGCGRM
jgi:hypothetical protein